MIIAKFILHSCHRCEHQGSSICKNKILVPQAKVCYKAWSLHLRVVLAYEKRIRGDFKGQVNLPHVVLKHDIFDMQMQKSFAIFISSALSHCYLHGYFQF